MSERTAREGVARDAGGSLGGLGAGAGGGAGARGTGDPACAPSVARELARILRQRAELWGGDLFLERFTRAEVLALAARLGGLPSWSMKAERGAAGRVSGARGPVAAAPSGPTAPPPAPETASCAAAGVRERPVAERAPAVPATAPPPDLAEWPRAGEYLALRAEALACVRCRLHRGRTQAVFSDGNPRARVMVVGEGPGAEEDRLGLPFVGPAGKLLDLLLATVALSRASVYICNVVKCRPPGNRNPLPDEIEACFPYLQGQIEQVGPDVILAVGSIAAQTLLGRQDALWRFRGVVHRYEGIPVIVTYHPAALLRNPRWTRAAWEDLQLLKRTLGGGRATDLAEIGK